MKNTGKIVCCVALLLVVLFVAGCVNNGIATDHANESILGTWVCDQGLMNDRINITFNGDGTANLIDILENQSTSMNYTWNRQETINMYIAVGNNGDRVMMQYFPENATVIDNAGNLFRKENY